MIDDSQAFERLVADPVSFSVGTMILAFPRQQISQTMMDHARRIAGRVFIEVYTEDTVEQCQPFKPDGFVIRGNEAGGICSNMSNPTLLRKIREKTSLPVWIYGGIGFQSALALAIGGADGVILSDCLALIPDLADELKEQDRKALNAGIRTQALDIGNGLHVRIGESYPELINQIKVLCAEHDKAQFEKRKKTVTRIADVLAVMKQHRATARCFMGEEAAWAPEFGRRYATLQDLMQELKRVVLEHPAVLGKNYPLSRKNALAKELNTEFPILQGPMTHVSDTPDFLAQVAQNGAVPFAALALSKGEKLEALMRETQKKVGNKPWGVGILGFAPKALQDEQIAMIEKYRPGVAIVAGGRPSHYHTLQRIGVLPFLHIPVPSMIPTYFKEGVRHFIFEGRGCGGHIGPINSYTLWQSALIAFQQLAAEGEDLTSVRIAFAGGIYDAMSAAMTSAFCVPLFELGVQFAFIVGTAYLFTREIKESAAITPAFQQVALDSDQTTILETRAGHAIRCAPTALISECYQEKAKLLNQGMSPAEIHERLEQSCIGRLRLAAKGVKRAGVYNGHEELTMIDQTDQVKEGLFMMGEVAALLDHVFGISDLHRSLCHDAVQVLRGSQPRISQADRPAETAVKAKPTDIAIIGMSIMAPGSENLDQFWQNVLDQLCCIEDVPEERWRPSVNYNPDPDHPDTTYSTKGGFLSDTPINCMEYGIPPGSVPHIEPAQLLALEAVKRALIDAGYETKEFDRTRTSVFFGFAGGGDLLLAYSVRAALKEFMTRATDIPDEIRDRVIQSLQAVLPEWSMDSFPGMLGNIIAGRVANRFNLNGLNFTVDAACASSMAALQVACQELAYGVTRTAIVGGVDASQHLFSYMCFSKTKALSLNGHPKPFSHDTDGIVLGEGVGVTVLKRLEDAIADGDRIYAVIKGVGGASDGKGSGMTVPKSRGQLLAVERACEVAGLTTDQLDLIEAHGTGTPLGDRIELETIHKLLQDHGASQPCAIGSIKSAIGHTKGAAGVIGLIKAALALYHKVLPAHLNVDKIHPALVNPQSQLYLNTQTRPWFRKSAQRPRRAGVSAFGFGGTNFHSVLEEYGDGTPAPADVPRSLWPAELVLFGAPDIQTLIKRIDAAIGSMDPMEKTDASLATFAFRHYLNQASCAAMPVRLAVKAHRLEQLKDRLVQSKKLIEDGAMRSGQQASKNSPRLADGIWGSLGADLIGPPAALFPGQGSQKLHMLRELAVVFPVVRTCLEQANAELADEFSHMEHGILTDYIYPPNHENPEEKKQAQNALTQTQVAQPVLAAVEMALFNLLAQFNVKIAMAAGHSFGELTALWSAGVMTDRQLLTLASKRGRCMADSSKVETGMSAVFIERNALGEFIAAAPELTLANHNAPKQAVVSGSVEALERLEAYCRQQKWGYKRLAVSQGFHSPYMAKAAEQWQHELSSQHFSSPRFPVYANMTATPYGKATADITGMLGQHLQNGVAFVEQIETMYADGARTFVEIGPGSILTHFVEAILADKPHHSVAVQPQNNASGLEMLLDCLAALHACGCPVDLRPAYVCRKVSAKERTGPQPSATLFLVNGRGAKPTVEFKARKSEKADPSIWKNPPQFPPPPAMTASTAQTVDESLPATTALHPGTAADPHRPAPSKPARPARPVKLAKQEKPVKPEKQERPETRRAQDTPAAMRPLSRDQGKLGQLRHFQKSMHLFLENQERFQKKRLEMMEKMWNLNQQVVQNLLGGAPSVNTAAFADFASESKMEEFTLDNRTVAQDMGALAPAPQADSAFVPETGSNGEDSHLPAEKAEQDAPIDFSALLFDIISERTQYPVEMLALDQDIEADLGIDSIKRVEIITMLRDTHPSLRDIANEKYYEEMAQLRTLGDIVTWVDRTFGCSPQPDAHQKETGQQEVLQTPASSAGAVKLDSRSLLFDIVSERTQYPVEMLSLDQDIEADLGIDSIKRVEIITMLRDTHPSLSNIADEKYYEEMAQLRTLGDVVAWVDKTFGEPDVPDRQPLEFEAETEAGDRKATQDSGKSNGKPWVLDLIGEKTRYPVELIDMDLSLEQDLGMSQSQLDEIISDLTQSLFPSAGKLPDPARQSTKRLKTVQDLVHWMEQAWETNINDGTLGAADEPERYVGVEEYTETSLFRRYELKLIEQPLDRSEACPLSGVLMILDGGHPLGKQIQTDAEKQGIRCARVTHAGNGVAEHQDSIRLTADQEKDYEKCYHRLKASHGTPRGVINLLSLGKPSHEENYKAVMQSFLWAKTIGADPDLHQDNQWNLFWVSVTGMGGDFGLNRVMDFEATQNGLHGITKCLYHEWPGLQAKTIDLHPGENPEQLSRYVLGECCERYDTIKEIGFLNHRRHALGLIDRPHDSGDIQPRLTSDSVLLITGGAKGITAEVAFLLAEQYQPTLILVGRTPLPERSPDELERLMDRARLGENDPKSLKSQIINELKPSVGRVTPALVNDRYNAIMNEYKVRQNIEKMERLKAKVFYYACDCTNDPSFSELIRNIYQTFHKIDGVIHAAGCLKDAAIAQKSMAHFKQVLDTKIEGARILLRELDFNKLDFIVFFSSVSGRFGNRGQVDYAAANEILNKMAARLDSQWPGKAVAINWGPWEGEGMVSSQVKEQFIKAGVYLLPRDLGASMLNREIHTTNRVSEVVIFGIEDVENRLPVIPHHSPLAGFQPDLPFVQLFKKKGQPAGNTFVWELELDQNAPYLNDHRIDDVPVLAAAISMEIMAQAGLAAAPEYRFKGIQEFDLYKGIIVASDHPLKLMVSAKIHQTDSPDNLIAEVQLALPNQVNRFNYACQVLLGKTDHDPMQEPSHCTHSLPFEDSVENVYENRLFHKGVFRGLKRIESLEITDLENSGIKGIIESSVAEQVIGAGVGGMWLIDPIVFDSACQLALLWVQERFNMMALPSSIEQYRLYRSYDKGPVHCEVVIKETHFPRILMDFILKDKDGGLYAKAIDVAAVMSKGLNERLLGSPHKLATVHY